MGDRQCSSLRVQSGSYSTSQRTRHYAPGSSRCHTHNSVLVKGMLGRHISVRCSSARSHTRKSLICCEQRMCKNRIPEYLSLRVGQAVISTPQSALQSKSSRLSRPRSFFSLVRRGGSENGLY